MAWVRRYNGTIMRHDPRGGFTLIEIVVSVFLIGAATMLFAASLNTLSFTHAVRYDDIALRIANNKLETLRAGGYDALPASGAFTDPILPSLPQGTASTTITTFNAKTKEVVVQVGWKQDAATRVLTIATLITQGGI